MPPMTNRQTAMLLLPGTLLLGGVVFAGSELHRVRAASEATAEKVGALVDAVRSTPRPAKCLGSVSHLDHDVDLGTVHECADAPGVSCVTYQGKEITSEVAASRCKAGTL